MDTSEESSNLPQGDDTFCFVLVLVMPISVFSARHMLRSLVADAEQSFSSATVALTCCACLQLAIHVISQFTMACAEPEYVHLFHSVQLVIGNSSDNL